MRIKNLHSLSLSFFFILLTSSTLFAQENEQTDTIATPYAILDDTTILNGYTEKYKQLSEEVILAMMKDDTLTAYKSTAAIRVFKLSHAKEMVGQEKKIIEKILLRRLNRTNSPFVQVEVMHTLCVVDRYKYFKSMVPVLIQKLDHYNSTVNEMAYGALNNLVETGNNRSREARIIFNTLRKQTATPLENSVRSIAIPNVDTEIHRLRLGFRHS